MQAGSVILAAGPTRSVDSGTASVAGVIDWQAFPAPSWSRPHPQDCHSRCACRRLSQRCDAVAVLAQLVRADAGIRIACAGRWPGWLVDVDGISSDYPCHLINI